MHVFEEIDDRVYRESRVSQRTAWSLHMKNFKQQQHHLIEFEYASSRQLKLLLIHPPTQAFAFSPYMYIYSLCPTSYKYALLLVGLWAYKFRAIFPTFYSKNYLQKLENKPAIYRPLSRSHQSKINKKIYVFKEIDNRVYRKSRVL